NERSLRLLATGLETGERAEAFTRFTTEGDKNFLKYRKLRAWARGRGPGWEDGDLHFYVKAGKDQNNFYLYHAPARTSSWEPEVGTAAAVDLTLTAADVAEVAVSVSRRDAQFRQLGEDPRYQTDGAASVAGTLRLERFFPSHWGIAAPLTVRYASLASDPFYLSGTDIRADALEGLRTPRSTATSYAVSIRRTARSPSPLLRLLVDPLALSGAWASGNTR